MKKIGIFYGSTTGTTANIATKISKALNVDIVDVHNVAKSAPSDVAPYALIIMGTSTWGDGDMQEDWFDFLDGLEALDLSSKKFAIFGCGDETMSETFCSGMGQLYERVKKTGATHIGDFNEEGFHFKQSGAVVNDKVIGLVIDEVNHPELTTDKINAWCSEIAQQI